MSTHEMSSQVCTPETACPALSRTTRELMSATLTHMIKMVSTGWPSIWTEVELGNNLMLTGCHQCMPNLSTFSTKTVQNPGRTTINNYKDSLLMCVDNTAYFTCFIDAVDTP